MKNRITLFVALAIAMMHMNGCKRIDMTTETMSRITQLKVIGLVIVKYREEFSEYPAACGDENDRKTWIDVILESEGAAAATTDSLPECLRANPSQGNDNTTVFYALWNNTSLEITDDTREILVIEAPPQAAYTCGGGLMWSIEDIIAYYNSHPEVKFHVLFDDGAVREITASSVVLE